MRRTTARQTDEPDMVLDAGDVLRLQALVREVPVADHVIHYALRLVRATRIKDEATEEVRPKMVRDYLAWGAGPRASQCLIIAAKAKAVLGGSMHVTPDHVRAVAKPVLRHRLITNFNAEADGVTTDAVIEALLKEIPVEGAGGAERKRMDSVMR